MPDKPRIDPTADVRDPVMVSLSRIGDGRIHEAVLAVVVAIVVGFGSGFLEWRSYSGLRIHESEFLSLVGLTSLCWLLARAALWALRSNARSDSP